MSLLHSSGGVTTHTDAETRFVAADGVDFAYRRFGAGGGPPLVFFQHFRGNLDNWDPALVDGIGRSREIILVDLPGVGASGGEPLHTVAGMTRSTLAFLDALGLREVDLFGFSLGGFIAQEVALVRPWMVRRLVLAGTGPRGGALMHGWREDIQEKARHDQGTAEDLLYIFYAHTETSQRAGGEALGRIFARTEGRDLDTTLALRDAQYDAVVEWGVPDHAALQRLTGISAPTLILQGDRDLMIPPQMSHLMAGLIPKATIKIYPDAGHGSIFQHAAEAVADVVGFLS